MYINAVLTSVNINSLNLYELSLHTEGHSSPKALKVDIQVGPVQIVALQGHLKHTGTHDNLQYPGWSSSDCGSSGTPEAHRNT
jgi:hypothetical protein